MGEVYENTKVQVGKVSMDTALDSDIEVYTERRYRGKIREVYVDTEVQV